MADTVFRTKIRTVAGLNKAVAELIAEEDLLEQHQDHFAREAKALAKRKAKAVDPQARRVARLRASIEEFCEHRWDEVSSPAAPDTAFLRTGTLKRRFNRPSIGKLTAVGVRLAVARLKKVRGGRKFIRTVEELDAKSLIANPAMAQKAGIAIVQGRRLEIVPPVTQVTPTRIKKR